jgi:hypothetical protein
MGQVLALQPVIYLPTTPYYPINNLCPLSFLLQILKCGLLNCHYSEWVHWLHTITMALWYAVGSYLVQDNVTIPLWSSSLVGTCLPPPITKHLQHQSRYPHECTSSIGFMTSPLATLHPFLLSTIKKSCNNVKWQISFKVNIMLMNIFIQACHDKNTTNMEWGIWK